MVLVDGAAGVLQSGLDLHGVLPDRHDHVAIDHGLALHTGLHLARRALRRDDRVGVLLVEPGEHLVGALEVLGVFGAHRRQLGVQVGRTGGGVGDRALADRRGRRPPDGVLVGVFGIGVAADGQGEQQGKQGLHEVSRVVDGAGLVSLLTREYSINSPKSQEFKVNRTRNPRTCVLGRDRFSFPEA